MSHQEFVALMFDLDVLCREVRRAEEDAFYNVPMSSGIELEAARFALREARDRLADQ